MSVHTCPRCELRFSRRAEMCDHLVTDHHLGHPMASGIGHLVAVGGGAHRRVPNPLSGGNTIY